MQTCSKCQSNEYTNKSLIMLVNECGHPLCTNCVDILYVRNVAPCHVCGRPLKKYTFWEQIFEDPYIERDNHVRKRLTKIYNLKEDDFSTLRDFNDYLEKFEDIVCNLANDIDVENTESDIAKFKTDNAELIEKNWNRLSADQLWVMEQLKEERERKRLHETQTGRESMDTGVSFADSSGYHRRNQRSYVYTAPILPINGPTPSNIEYLENLGYLQHIRASSDSAMAGGYVTTTTVARALFEARWDLHAF